MRREQRVRETSAEQGRVRLTQGFRVGRIDRRIILHELIVLLFGVVSDLILPPGKSSFAFLLGRLLAHPLRRAVVLRGFAAACGSGILLHVS